MMTAENIIMAINAEYNSSVDYLQALQNLANENPWFSIAHQLSAIEAHRLNDENFDSFLQAASLYSKNRNCLYLQIKQPKINNLAVDFAPPKTISIDDEAPIFDYPVVDYFANEKVEINPTSENAVDKFLTSAKKISIKNELKDDIKPENIDKTPDDDIEFATEILGKIYAEQGYISKAIAVYKKLSLQDSKKSVYFATLIENLKREYKK